MAASPAANVDYKFSPLPQSEESDDQPLSLSIETARPNIDHQNHHSQDFFIISPRTLEYIQDLLGLIFLLMLILLPFYNRMGSPPSDPVPPVFTLNSMYVSNFTTATGELAATWDAKFTVISTNVSSIYFRNLDFIIFYKQNPEDALAIASSDAFYLEQGKSAKLHLKFVTTGWEDNQPFVEDSLVEQIGKDRAKNDALNFGMRVKVDAIYYGQTWVSDVEINPHCEGLRVQFLPNKGSGRLVEPNRNFSVPIEWKPFSWFDS